MNKYLVIFFLLAGFYVFGQNEKISNLREQIRSHHDKDTFFVNRLNELSNQPLLTLSSRDSAANEALKMAREIDYSKGEMTALQALAEIKYLQGNMDGSSSFLDQALVIAESENDNLAQFDILIDKAMTQMNVGQNNNGLETLMKVADLAEKLPGKRWLSQAQGAIAAYYSVAQIDLPLAMEWSLKSLNTAIEAGCVQCQENTWIRMATIYSIIGDQEQALIYFQKVMKSMEDRGAEKNNNLLNSIGERYRLMGMYPEAVAMYKEGILGEKDPINIEIYESNLADTYVRMDSLPQAFKYAFKSLNDAIKLKDQIGIAWIESILARAYLKKNRPDSTIYHASRGLEAARDLNALEYLRDNSEALAQAYDQLGDYENAYLNHRLFIKYRDSMVNENVANQVGLLQYNYNREKTEAQIATLHQEKQNQRNLLITALAFLALIITTAILLFRNNRQKQKANALLSRQKAEIDSKAKELVRQKEDLQQSYENVELLSEIGRKITSSLSVETIISTAYNQVNKLMDAAVFGVGIYHKDSDSIDFPATMENGIKLPPYSNSMNDRNRLAVICFTENREIILRDLATEYQEYVQEIASPHEGHQPVSLIYLPLSIKDRKLGVITVQSFEKNTYSDYHLYMLRNMANYTAIALDNAESYSRLDQTLTTLRSAQSQLIHSEKMASLGELTAGIAHEIQNPLNFVNNFSEINIDLIDEMNEEIDNGNLEEVKELAGDIRTNEEKIVFHGKRADGIVKSMLQHSRSSSNIQELTDLNNLCDEYLRLAFHGMRAKDKTFNSAMETDFDPDLEKIQIVPQDIGRVLLNLLTNAFFEVNEKRKSAEGGYQPMVRVKTSQENGCVAIEVIDNGRGIDSSIQKKIFQPFFTTKSTGKGTGLGLSLSYDIIKAHNGEITVASNPDMGTVFKIQLPLNPK